MLSIVFGRTTSVYKPGELLSGDIVINTTAHCRILDLTVNYCGFSEVSFLVSEGEGKSRTCQKVEETATHLDVLHPIVKNYRGVPIRPGVHTYHFSLRLPLLLPSAYRSPYGVINYHVQVHLQTSTQTLNVRKPFVVLAPVNINLFPMAQNEQSIEIVKKYGLVGNNTLHLKASVARTCFVPGEVIPVTLEVTNGTGRQLRYLFCTLKQITKVLVKWQEETFSRETKQCLVTIAHKLKKSEGCYSWRCQLPTPSQLTPTIAASTNVFVMYSIQVSAKLKRVPIPPEVQIPIVFGVRVALREQQEIDTATRRVRYQSLSECSSSDLSEEADSQHQLTATNPRRRVTVCTQPQFSTTNTNSPTRKISTHIQNVAMSLKRRINSQLQLLPTRLDN